MKNTKGRTYSHEMGLGKTRKAIAARVNPSSASRWSGLNMVRMNQARARKRTTDRTVFQVNRHLMSITVSLLAIEGLSRHLCAGTGPAGNDRLS